MSRVGVGMWCGFGMAVAWLAIIAPLVTGCSRSNSGKRRVELINGE